MVIQVQLGLDLSVGNKKTIRLHEEPIRESKMLAWRSQLAPMPPLWTSSITLLQIANLYLFIKTNFSKNLIN